MIKNKALAATLAASLVLPLNAKSEKNLKEFGDQNLKVKVEYTSEVANKDANKETVILETVKKLAKEMDPAKAAKLYIEQLKSIFNKLKENNSLFNDKLKECKTNEEFSMAFGQMMQKMMDYMGSKENTLEQATLFAALSDEAINDVKVSMVSKMQGFMSEITMLQMATVEKISEKAEGEEKDQQEEKNKKNEMFETMKAKTYKIFDVMVEATEEALKKHYKI